MAILGCLRGYLCFGSVFQSVFDLQLYKSCYKDQRTVISCSSSFQMSHLEELFKIFYCLSLVNITE